MHAEQTAEFVQSCNRSLGIGDPHQLNQLHLQQLSEQFELTPIAFLNTRSLNNPRGHWTLVVRKTGEEIEVYDPKIGLREVGLQEINKIWYFPKGQRRQHVPKYFLTHIYELPREKLRELGALQEGDGNCAQLCVYAAKYAKGL